MLWTILLALSVFWALGVVTTNTMGGAIHLLLLVALIMLIYRAFQARKSMA